MQRSLKGHCKVIIGSRFIGISRFHAFNPLLVRVLDLAFKNVFDSLLAKELYENLVFLGSGFCNHSTNIFQKCNEVIFSITLPYSIINNQFSLSLMVPVIVSAH